MKVSSSFHNRRHSRQYHTLSISDAGCERVDIQHIRATTRGRILCFRRNHFHAVAAPGRCSWQVIDRSLVAAARAVKISWYIMLLLPLLTARAAAKAGVFQPLHTRAPPLTISKTCSLTYKLNHCLSLEWRSSTLVSGPCRANATLERCLQIIRRILFTGDTELNSAFAFHSRWLYHQTPALYPPVFHILRTVVPSL